MAFIIYNANFREIAAGDSLPARFLPLALWSDGTVYLDPVVDVTIAYHTRPYWILRAPNGHFASMYPIVTPVLLSPLYAPAALYLTVTGWTDERLSAVGHLMEKLAASFVASVTVGLFYLLVRRRMSEKWALLLTVALGFATNTWATSSQALWQHGVTELLVVVALLALDGGSTSGRLAVAGAACGLLVANRPPDVLLTAGFGVFALLESRARSWPFVLAAAAAGLPFVAYNLHVFGRFGGGYSYVLATTLTGGPGSFFSLPLFPGVAGLLVSPGKGLLVFCPFFIFIAGQIRYRFAEARTRKLAISLAAAVVALTFLYAKTDWRAGSSYGPRFMVDAAPILTWLLVPVVDTLKRHGRVVFLALVGFGMVLQAIGAFCYPKGGSDDRTGVWDYRNPPFLVEARAGLMRPAFLDSLRKRWTTESIQNSR